MKHAPRKRRFRRERAVAQAQSARDVAFAVLSEYKNGGRFVSTLLEPFFQNGALASADERRLAVELTNGVVRREATLDTILRPHVQRPRHRIEGELWTLLQLGAYQLVFLDAIPAYAAVNETVALAKAIGRERWSGFLNGVLRSVERMLTEEFRSAPSPLAVPVSEGRFRCLSNSVFAEPSVDAAGYFAEAFSFPLWLAASWSERFDFEELCRIGFWFNRPAALTLRVNSLKNESRHSTEVTGRARSRREGGSAAGSDSSGRNDARRRFARLRGRSVLSPGRVGHASGRAVGSQAGGNGSRSVCRSGNENDAHRRADGESGHDCRHGHPCGSSGAVTENCLRLGISIVQPLLICEHQPTSPNATTALGPAAGPFDALLADVPCSNTGVLGKRPEARWRIKPAEIDELAAQQLALLRSACRRLRPGGRILYSTCSIEPQENAQVVRAVLDREPMLSLVEEWHQLPGRPSDGGYQALLVRSSEAT